MRKYNEIMAAMCLLAAIAATPVMAADSGLTAWEKIVGVLQHPRCMNCHQATSPLQTDDRKPHTPRVVGGPTGTGTSAMRCATCHKATIDAMTGAPGAKDWHLAPATMVWQNKSSAELCAMLKDTKANGGRDGKALIAHMNEPLVVYGWAPGGKRSPVPLAHKDFIAAMQAWVGAGMPCPK